MESLYASVSAVLQNSSSLKDTINVEGRSIRSKERRIKACDSSFTPDGGLVVEKEHESSFLIVD